MPLPSRLLTAALALPAAVLGVAALAARPAEACTCVEWSGTPGPADGAVDVALNLTILTTEERAITLLDATDAPVPLIFQSAGSGPAGELQHAIPIDLLAPLATYRLHIDGVLTSTFTTGEESDSLVPTLYDLAIAEAWTAPYSRGCADESCLDGERYSEAGLTVTLAPDTMWIELQFQSSLDGSPIGSPTALPAYGAWGTLAVSELIGRLQSGSCSINPPDGEGWCVEITAFDEAGNTASLSTCTIVEQCETVSFCDAEAEPLTCIPADYDDEDDSTDGDPGGCSTSGAPQAGGLGFALAAVVVGLGLSRRRRRSA